MKNKIHWVTMLVILFVFCWLTVEKARADDLFGGESFFSESTTNSGDNTIWKSDGSLVIIKGAEDSGYVIKDGEIEYFVVPKNDGSNTFIYDNGLTICNSNGCY